MVGRPDYRSPLAAFRTPDAPKLVTKALRKFTLAVTEIQGAARHGTTASLPDDDAYLIQLRLRECRRCDYFAEGRHLSAVDHRAGLTMIHDLRRDPIVDLQDPFHVLHLYLPRKVLDGIADEAGAPPIRDLHVAPSDTFEDPVTRDLLSSLRPALAKPTEASALFVDHVAHALCVHVAQRYGEMPTSLPPRGGLAPWQERRARELLNANLDGEISLSQLAVECGLSVRHFTRAFRRSIGVPPHRYLLKCRVERAQQLLKDPTLSLLDVALACGFSDQSHFTRVFNASTSMSPGVWRRMRISKTRG
jgi:AraC-like DNA-binding protein